MTSSCWIFVWVWCVVTETVPVAHDSFHYDDVIMSAIASQITSLTIVYSTIYPSADQSKHQSSASLAFVWGIHRRPVNSPHKWPVTRKMFPFDDVIMHQRNYREYHHNMKPNDKEIPSNLLYKSHLHRQWNCWSLRCGWSIAWRRCPNYIFILDLSPGFNGLSKDNCKTGR